MTTADQKLKNAQVFLFDIENTLFDVIGPGIKAQAHFLPAVAKKLGIDTDTFGREIDRALRLEFQVLAPEVAHLTPSVISKAGEAGYLDGEEAFTKLEAIYSAKGDDAKKHIAEFNDLYKDAISGKNGFLAKEAQEYNKISHTGLDLFPHIKDFLRELRSRGFPVICVSSKNVSGLVPNVKHFGLDREVDLIISAPDNMTLENPDKWNFKPAVVHAGLAVPHIVFPNAGMAKKHPQGFTEISKVLGFDVTHAAMTGDNPPEDIDGMQKQGGLGILAGWGDTRPDMLPLKDYHWYYANALNAGESVVPDFTFKQPLDFIQRIRELDLKADPAIKDAILKRVAQLSAPSKTVSKKFFP